MSSAKDSTFFIVNARQGDSPADGWRVASLSGARLEAEGLRLDYEPAPPVPLKDGSGSFGGLENATGVAVAPDGAIYVSDADKNLIYKIVRREGLRARAHFFRTSGGGAFGGGRFVYVPTTNRVELWPRAIRHEPQSFDEVEVLCETAFDIVQARRVVLAHVGGEAGGGSCCEECSEAASSCSCGSRAKRRPCSCGKTSSTNKSSSTRKCASCAGHKKLKAAGGAFDKDGASINKEEVSNERAAAAIEKEWSDFYPAHLPAGDICKTFAEYLSCLGGTGREPRRLNGPRGLAVSKSGDLYVADTGNHRVQVFALDGLALRAAWGKRARLADVQASPPADECTPGDDAHVRVGQPIAGDAPGQFCEPWDVACDARGNVYVADKGNGRVQKYDRRARSFTVIDGTTLAARVFRVRYGTLAGDLFVYVPARRRVEQWPHALGHEPANADELNVVAEDVASTRDARRAVLEALSAVGSEDILAESVRAYPAALDAAQPEEPFASPTHLAIDRRGSLYVVDAGRDYVKILDARGRVTGRVVFAEEVKGRFRPTAVAVDEDGRLLLASDDGAHSFRVEDGTTFYERFFAAWRCKCAAMITDGAGNLVSAGGRVVGVAEMKPPRGFVRQGAYLSHALDSRAENCQWHKVVFDEGFDVPVGTSVTARTYTSHFELGQSEVEALDDDEWLTNQTNASDFLILSRPGRYLWLKIELRGSGVETPAVPGLRLHYPRVTYLEHLPAVYRADPVGRDFLGRFLSIFENILGGIEETVADLARLFDADGAPAESRRDFLSWLAGWVDMSFDPSWTDETRRTLLRHAPELYRMRGTPEGLKLLLRLALGIEARIVEHFRLRQWLFLCGRSQSGGAQLWDNCVVKRLQLDGPRGIGDFALIGTGDPLRDPFFVYAHKFSVYVPAASVRSDLVERMLRHLVERERPAHAQFDIVKVEPRLRVGVQSTVGVDTHVGAYPSAVLDKCATLGYDTLLGCDESHEAGAAPTRLDGVARVGVSTRVG
jgi:phage tail-like protein